MPLYNSKGIVLRNQDLSEADKIVTLLTQKFGKIKGVAKGVRKTTSKFGSSVEIFTYADYLIYGKENKDLDIITQAQIIHSFKEIREDLNKLTIGAFIIELLDTLVAGKEKDPLLFNLILQTLTWLKGESNELIIPTFALKFITLSGLKPHLGKDCLLCHQVCDKMQFSPGQGGIICTSHRIEDGIMISDNIRGLLHQLLVLDISKIRKIHISPNLLTELQKILIDNYLKFHLQKPLKSMNTLKL
ncbi:MAG: DNA repair protein RecO [bacterium]|nr:DNA repair protein RecO [bacterium]